MDMHQWFYRIAIILSWVLIAVSGVAAQAIQVKPLSFSQYLSADYLKLAEQEKQEHATAAVEYYLKRSASAAKGKILIPEKVEDVGIPEYLLPMLRKARTSLVSVMTPSMVQTFPEQAAELQSWFDCWIFEETHRQRTKRIEQCREGFYDMRDRLYTAGIRSGGLKNLLAVDQPSIMVYFKPNSVALSSYTLQHIKAIAEDVKKSISYDITLNAYSGKDELDNGKITLAKRRAEAVKRALIDQGLLPDNISIFVFSKSEQTNDEARAYENRSVEIVLDVQ